MFIQTEQTPNPDSLKFIPGMPVLPVGTAEYNSAEAAAKASPLAEAIFKIDGVKSVFLSTTYLSVTKLADWDWPMLKTPILATIMTHYTSGMPVLNESAMGEARPRVPIKGLDEALEAQIREVLDTYIRPAVMQDGGDVELDSFEDGVLYLRMRGACAGCPSAVGTLKIGIENLVKHYVPEVQEVRQAEY